MYISVACINNTGKSVIMAEKNTADYDKLMGARSTERDGLRWLSVDVPPLRLSGLAFRKSGEALRRLPVDPAFPEAINHLGGHTAGVQLAFRSDTTNVAVSVRLCDDSKMNHIARIGSSGFDLYVGPPKQRWFIGASRFAFDADSYEVKLNQFPFPGGETREFLINFPLYSGVESFELGLDPGSSLEAPEPWDDPRPVVIYGTSITQGGCASRPGMAWTNILSRKWNLPVLNFGFSGSGKGEPEVIRAIARVADPRMFVLDYEPNAGPEGIRKTLEGTLDILRSAHPETPIVVISSTRHNPEIPAAGALMERAAVRRESRDFQYETVRRRRAAGDRNIAFVDGGLPDADWHEHTVDGVHPTDLGFYRIAGYLAPFLEEWL